MRGFYMFEDYVIRDIDQKKVNYSFVINKLKELMKEGYSIHIGTDSQNINDKMSVLPSNGYV